MRDETRLSPEVAEVIDGILRDRANRPAPFEDEETMRREVALAGSARLGLVPMLVEGEEWFKHKDGLTPEDLPLVAAWYGAEADAWEARAERALFERDVRRSLESLEPPSGRAPTSLAGPPIQPPRSGSSPSSSSPDSSCSG